jgi:dihydroorotase
VLFDPEAQWLVGAEPLASKSANTPLLGERLCGKVLLTMAGGRVVYHDRERLPLPSRSAAHV